MNLSPVATANFIESNDNEDTPVGPSPFQFVWDDEVSAVRDFHEQTIAAGDRTWHHFIFYSAGQRIARIKCRAFNGDIERGAVFTIAAMLIPLLRADEVVWIADTTMRFVEKDEAVRLGMVNDDAERNETDFNRISQFLHSSSASKAESLVVVGVNQTYWRGSFMAYNIHDGQVHWIDELSREADSNQPTAELLQFEGHVVDDLMALLNLETEGLPNGDSLIYVLSRTGYELKIYTDDEG